VPEKLTNAGKARLGGRMTAKQFDLRLGLAGLARHVAAGFLMVVCLAAVAPAVAADGLKPASLAAKTGERPGETDPINNPKKLTLFQVSTIGLLASQNSASYSDLFDFAAADAQLKQWTLTAQKLQQGDSCLHSQRRRLGHGRVSTPEFEQAVCMTNFGVTLYTSPLKMNDGSHVTRAFARPAVDMVGRNFDLAVGELSRRPGEDEKLHQAIVAAYANVDQRLEIDVIEWIPKDKADPSQGELRVTASYIGPADEVPAGDVAVTLGDYMNDGTLQIISAADVSGGPGPGGVRLAAYRYLSDGDKRILERVGPSYVFDVPSGRPTSLALASADFVGRGHEQFIMSYLAPGKDANSSQLAFAYFDPAKLEHIGPSKAKYAIEPVARDSYADIAAGLFRFDPNSVAPPLIDPFFRRQLAVAYATPEGKILARVLQIRDDDPPVFHPGPTAQISADKWPIATAGLGPSIAAGNFIGLKTDGVDPRGQIAVALPDRGDKPGRIVPEIVVARVNGESFALDPVWRHRMPNYESSGLAFGVPILAYDRGGDSFYLGNPAHISIPDLIDPQYVVAMPPRHVDALPTPGAESPYEIVNLLAGVGPSAFNVTLRDSVDQILMETSTNSSSAQFGGGLTQTVGGTVGVGFMNIASFETSSSVKTAVSYETNSMQRNINRSYETITTQKAATTTQDDHLIFNMRVIDIWRFPVYGLSKKHSDKFPFYDIVIPGPLTEYSGGGLNYDWYNPSHQNYNATSYPAIPKQGLFAKDIGNFSFDAEGKKVEVLHKPLNSPIVRAFDGNAQTFSLDYTKESGSSSEKSFDYSLSASLDVTVGFRASANVRLFSGSANYEGTVNLSSRSNWARDVVAERSMRNSHGITLDQPDVPGITSKAYHYETLIYVTENGGIKVAHGADFLTSSGGARWWKSKYGGRPDPALNLPWRMTYDSSQGSWTLTPGDDYFRLRGLKLTEAVPDKLTDEYALLSGGVEQGTKVRFVLPVHNYSLDTAVENVVVAFAYQALDPASDKPVKLGVRDEFVEFARSKPVSIGPRGVVDVDVVWDTTNLGGAGFGIPYGFKIIVDPDDKIPNKLHGSDPASGAQTVGLWPWNGGFWVFNSTGNVEANGAQAPRLALNIERAAAVKSMAVGAKADVAAVTIDMPSADRSFRQLIVSGLGPDGLRVALASRTLYGLGPGKQRLDITLGDHEGLTSLQAWMSSGALRGEPREGIGATEGDSGGAVVSGH
jgi:hypothetical protein